MREEVAELRPVEADHAGRNDRERQRKRPPRDAPSEAPRLGVRDERHGDRNDRGKGARDRGSGELHRRSERPVEDQVPDDAERDGAHPVRPRHAPQVLPVEEKQDAGEHAEDDVARERDEHRIVGREPERDHVDEAPERAGKDAEENAGQKHELRKGGDPVKRNGFRSLSIGVIETERSV